MVRISLVFSLAAFLLFSCLAEDLVKKDAKAYREEGYRLQMMGDLEGALSYYEKAVQMDPHFLQVYNDIGIIYESKGNDNKAIEMYRKAIKINSAYAPAYTNLALLYERKADVENATYYWKKRYELGGEGDYWWEAAQQHLIELGKYPQVRRSILEYRAAQLSKEVIYKREQERLMSMEESQLHYDIGRHAFDKRDYETALQEFKMALSFNPPDEKFRNNLIEFYRKTEKLYLKDQASSDTQSALDYLRSGNYFSASEKLKSALASVFRITQEE